MKQVSVWYHKDGDQLVVTEVPAWTMAAEWIGNKLFCPCCGVSGFISRWEKPGAVVYGVWNWLIERSDKHERVLLKLAVDGCEASKALFPGEDHVCDICDPITEEEAGVDVARSEQ